jgi:hypothetical protein
MRPRGPSTGDARHAQCVASCFTRFALTCSLLSALASLLSAAAARADDRPAFSKLRQDEDWSSLRDPARRRGPLDELKFIPLDRDGFAYFSLGGELRERYEYTHNPVWGDDPQDKRGVFLQRYILHADLHFGPDVRFFTQMLSALETGRAGPAAVPDENRLDLQQAFVDLSIGTAGQGRATFRLGRQEMSYGSARLIDVREGPNVRRKFDGLRLRLDASDTWRVDGFAVRPTFDKPATFDDRTDGHRALWGAYAVGRPSWLPAGAIDLYYLGFHDAAGRYVQARGRETRHTIGTRLWGEHAGWDWNVELAFQAGKFNGGDIRAWTVASEIGHRWIDTPLKPRLALSANIASGDRNAGDRRLGTFNPLFPRGSYFDELALLGPRNFYNVHPFVTIWPHDDVSITADWDFFWRLETADGVYSPSGRILRAPNGSTARYVGSAVSLNATWQVDPRVALTGIYTHFFPGKFIRQTGPARDIDFVELTMKVTF